MFTPVTYRQLLVELILEYRQNLFALGTAAYPQSNESIRENLGREVLRRMDIERNVDLSCYPTISDILNVAQNLNISPDDMYVESSSKEDYDGYSNVYYHLRYMDKERDDEYYTRLKGMYHSFMNCAWNRNSDSLKLNLYEFIASRLYMARNITCDSSVISDCLSDLDRLYIAKNHDANGEMSELECANRLYQVENDLKLKYNIR